MRGVTYTGMVAVLSLGGTTHGFNLVEIHYPHLGIVIAGRWGSPDHWDYAFVNVMDINEVITSYKYIYSNPWNATFYPINRLTEMLMPKINWRAVKRVLRAARRRKGFLDPYIN